jgi:hypothetical protein
LEARGHLADILAIVSCWSNNWAIANITLTIVWLVEKKGKVVAKKRGKEVIANISFISTYLIGDGGYM